MEQQALVSVFSVVGFISTIAALILAVVAIWLSIVFFRMSSEISKSTIEAAEGIGASVDRLEKLFDKLYADTFSMMKDTVSDMRKHIWPDDKTGTDNLSEEIEKKADEKVGTLKKGMEKELSALLQRQTATDHNIHSLRSEMKQLLERAIAGSRNVEIEARKETLRDHVLKTLRMLYRKRPVVKAIDIVDSLPFSPVAIISELRKLKTEDFIRFDEPDGEIAPSTKIHISATIGRHYKK